MACSYTSFALNVNLNTTRNLTMTIGSDELNTCHLIYTCTHLVHFDKLLANLLSYWIDVSWQDLFRSRNCWKQLLSWRIIGQFYHSGVYSSQQGKPKIFYPSQGRLLYSGGQVTDTLIDRRSWTPMTSPSPTYNWTILMRTNVAHILILTLALTTFCMTLEWLSTVYILSQGSSAEIC